MLIFKPRKAVILKTKNPKKYLDVIPTAKEFVYNGLPLVAVPHKPDETKVLRNLGVNVPAPMNYYYPYDGRFKPFEVQRKTAEFASMNNRCFILNSMGLGKTVTSLWALDYMRSIGMVKKALVVCPISVMERAWGDEIFRTFPNLKFNVLYGSREKRLKLLAEDADIYVINTDGLKIIQQAMADRPDIYGPVEDGGRHLQQAVPRGAPGLGAYGFTYSQCSYGCLRTDQARHAKQS